MVRLVEPNSARYTTPKRGLNFVQGPAGRQGGATRGRRAYAIRMDDDALREQVDRASRGDSSAIEALLAENMPRLYAFVRLKSGSMIKSQESSSDIVQSVCREVLEGMGKFEYRGAAQFRAWLYTAAARKIADRVQYYRAQRRDVNREVGVDNVGSDDAMQAAFARIASPSNRMSAREGIQRIERAFARLAEEKREVILLSRVAGLTSAEIAARTGETDMAIRARLRRALAELAVFLDEPAAEA